MNPDRTSAGAPRRNTAWLIYLLAALVGLAMAVWIFTLPVLLGVGRFWSAPNYPDMQQHLSAARYYLADSWRFPIFLTKLIMPPEGVSVVFLDVNPLFALFDKLLFKATGLSFNYFGPWIAICYALQSAAFLFLCRALGLRGVIPAVACAVIAVSIPEFLFRYFHLNLLGQFFITAELALYVNISRNGLARQTPYALALPLICLLVHFYLFVMISAIFALILLEDFIRHKARRVAAAAYGGGFLAGVGILFYVCGYTHGVGASSGFGYFSMNLLSPFAPQQSGLFPGMSRIVDATGGQYEGFNYLGAGILLLAAVSLVLNRRRILAFARQYRYLFGLLIAFTVLAVSFNPFIGDYSLIRGRAVPAAIASGADSTGSAPSLSPAPPAPSPSVMQKAKDLFFYPLQQLRSSGRFFWPVGYCIAAFAIAGVFARTPPGPAAALLSVAALLQLIDASPLRAAIAHEMRAPTAEPVSSEMWEKLIALHGDITVLPSMDCAGAQSPLIPMFVFFASKSATPTHSAKLSRGPKADCPAELAAIAHTELGPDDLVVQLSPPIPAAVAQTMPGASQLCRPFAFGFVCSRKWPDIDAAGVVIDATPAGPLTQPFDARTIGRGSAK